MAQPFYPGHTKVSAIKVTATGDNELIPYNLIWEGTNKSLFTTDDLYVKQFISGSPHGPFTDTK